MRKGSSKGKHVLQSYILGRHTGAIFAKIFRISFRYAILNDSKIICKTEKETLMKVKILFYQQFSEDECKHWTFEICQICT